MYLNYVFTRADLKRFYWVTPLTWDTSREEDWKHTSSNTKCIMIFLKIQPPVSLVLKPLNLLKFNTLNDPTTRVDNIKPVPDWEHDIFLLNLRWSIVNDIYIEGNMVLVFHLRFNLKGKDEYPMIHKYYSYRIMSFNYWICSLLVHLILVNRDNHLQWIYEECQIGMPWAWRQLCNNSIITKMGILKR